MIKKYSVITKDPHILGGKPVITGTRIPLARILYLLKDGYTIESIHEEYPHINVKTIKQAVNEAVEIIDQYPHASV